MKKLMAVLLLCIALLAGCGRDDSSSLVYPAPASTAPIPALPEPNASASSAPHESVARPADDDEIIEITEKLFIAQTNDIYTNGEDYIGKTIKYQGIYMDTSDWDDGLDAVVHYVIRYGPGCCGYDGEAGFEVRWPEGVTEEWPALDDWVEVVGVLREEAYDSGYKILYVELTSLTVMEERGAEYVAT